MGVASTDTGGVNAHEHLIWHSDWFFTFLYILQFPLLFEQLLAFLGTLSTDYS